MTLVCPGTPGARRSRRLAAALVAAATCAWTATGAATTLAADPAVVYPETVVPAFGPAFELGEPIYGPPPFTTVGPPAVAHDGQDYLVVWSDDRDGHDAIYGTRIRGSDGQVLDAAGIHVSAGEASAVIRPWVAWDGDSYLVTWESGGARGSHVRPSDGALLDPGPVTLGSHPVSGATNGRTLVSLWIGEQASEPCYPRAGCPPAIPIVVGAWWSDFGTFSSAPVVFAIDGSAPPAAIATDGTDYLVVWGDGLGTRVRGSDGTVLDPAGVRVRPPGAASHVALAWSGSSYLLAWTDAAGVKAVRVRGDDLAILDPQPLAISPEPFLPGELGALSLSADASGWLVLWSHSGSVRACRVTAGGAVLDSPALQLDTAGRDPAAASDGAVHLVTWVSQHGAPGDALRGVRLRSADGSTVDVSPSLLSSRANEQGVAAVAWNGQDHLAIWRDFRSGTRTDLYGTRVRGADGTILDPQGIPIATAPGDKYDDAVAWGGGRYLVVWSDQRGGDFDVYGARIDAAGNVLDPGGFPIAAGPGEQLAGGVAGADGVFLVSWCDAPSRDAPTCTVVASRISASDGSLLDVPGTVLGSTDLASIAVGSDGTDFLALWSTGAHGEEDLVAARVRGSDGAVLDAEAIAVSTAEGWQVGPEVAWDGREYVVVWKDGRSGWMSEVYGARVRSEDGTVLDHAGIPLATGNPVSSGPALACDGTRCLLVWSDGRVMGTRERAVYAVVLDPAAAADPYPFVATGSLTRYDAPNPAVAAAGGGGFLLAYDTFDADPAFLSTRVVARHVTTATAHRPLADSRNVTVVVGGSVAVTLTGTDADGGSLRDEVVSWPAHGRLERAQADHLWTYTPFPGYVGPDAFTFAVDNGHGRSDPATVSIEVVPGPRNPEPGSSGGCSCRQASAAPAAWALLGLAVLLRPRRRPS